MIAGIVGIFSTRRPRLFWPAIKKFTYMYVLLGIHGPLLSSKDGGKIRRLVFYSLETLLFLMKENANDI